MIPEAPLPSRPIRFGTRGSALALAQTELAMAKLRAVQSACGAEARVIRTEGDIDVTSPLTEIGGQGVFTNVIELAILHGEVDAAVHSAKDLPSALHPALPIVAMPDRGDPRDVLVSRHRTTLELLPPNPVIGTSSRRREAQIRHLRPDARLVSIRGNIDTRLKKAAGADYDAIVLAAAGVRRMGWDEQVSEYFAVERFVPSPGQGAIAVQALAGSAAAFLLTSIDDSNVSTPVRIERAFLAAIGLGCAMPVGAYVSAEPAGFRLVAMLADAAGERLSIVEEPLSPGDELRQSAETAARLLHDCGMSPGPAAWGGWDGSGRPLSGARVVVTRPRQRSGQLMAALTERGAEAVALPTIRIEPVADTAVLDAALRDAAGGAFGWIAFTSANAVNVVAGRLKCLGIEPDRLGGVRVAALGPATAAAVQALGLAVSLVPESACAEDLAVAMVAVLIPGETVFYPRSAIGRDDLPEALRSAGAVVTIIDAYQTVQEAEIDPQVVAQIREHQIDAIAFSSPSSVRGLMRLLGDDRALLTEVAIVCAGPVTAHAAQEAGLQVTAVSADPGATAMADAVAAHLAMRESRGAAGSRCGIGCTSSSPTGGIV